MPYTDPATGVTYPSFKNPKTGGRYYQKPDGTMAVIPGAVGGPALTVQDQKMLNDLNTAAATASEVKNQYNQIKPALKRLKTGPFSGAVMDALMPQEKGDLLNKVTSTIIGGPAIALGIIPKQQVTDYQDVKRIQQKRVLEEQTRQKGVQTEGDAARIAQAVLSTRKTPEENLNVVAADSANQDRVIGRAPFYTTWAAKYGINRPNEKGQGVEQAYQASLGHTATSTTPAGWSLVGQ